MGYDTTFDGQFKCSPVLKPEHREYLKAFANTRRMERNADVAAQLPDELRTAVGLPIGEYGCYFVGGVGFCGQDDDPSVRDHNRPPAGQPGLWCQWVPTENGQAIEWDGSEKFYDYVEWIEYLIVHFLEPWGYKLNGVVQWQGDESEDMGRVVIEDNAIRVLHANIEWGDEAGASMIVARCPNNPAHKRFITVATVLEEWVVDENGNFKEQIPGSGDVIHRPHPDNTWTCEECGVQAIVEVK